MQLFEKSLQSSGLFIGCQFGIQLYDWDGSTLIFNYNFVENGIGIDERQVTGAMAKGKKTTCS